MKLTIFTRHSVKVLLFSSSKKGELTTIDEVANYYNISRNHLMKVVHNLAKKGYIQTIRGKYGGVRLAISEEKINLGELVQFTEENLVEYKKSEKDTDCNSFTKEYDIENVINKAETAYINFISKFTLADLEKPF